MPSFPVSAPIKPSLSTPPLRVLVLAGGWSSEREVSMSSGQGIMGALLNIGHRAEHFDPPAALDQLVTGILASFEGLGPQVIFNILHGNEGENGVVQGVLELLKIPYTFSGVLGSALSMNKSIARQIVSAHGVPCPPGQLVTLDTYLETCTTFPHVCKPLCEGSTFGVQFVASLQDQKRVYETWEFGHDMLVETYIPGREVQVAVFDGIAMGSVEVCFEGPIFSYEAKYVEGRAQHLIPAPIHPEAHEKILRFAEIAHKALQCKGVTRTDFRYDSTQTEPGEIFFLETNPQPGFTPLSLVPEIAFKIKGWTYEEVVQWVINDALCRQ